MTAIKYEDQGGIRSPLIGYKISSSMKIGSKQADLTS